MCRCVGVVPLGVSAVQRLVLGSGEAQVRLGTTVARVRLGQPCRERAELTPDTAAGHWLTLVRRLIRGRFRQGSFAVAIGEKAFGLGFGDVDLGLEVWVVESHHRSVVSLRSAALGFEIFEFYCGHWGVTLSVDVRFVDLSFVSVLCGAQVEVDGGDDGSCDGGVPSSIVGTLVPLTNSGCWLLVVGHCFVLAVGYQPFGFVVGHENLNTGRPVAHPH